MLQLKRNLAILRKIPDAPSLEKVLDQWRQFCQKPPKGFEKYFKPGGAGRKEVAEKPESGSKESKQDGSSAPKQAPSPQSSKSASGSKPDQWSFGVFGGSR